MEKQAINPVYEGFDKSAIDLLLSHLALPDDVWADPTHQPKKEGDLQLWMWKKK